MRLIEIATLENGAHNNQKFGDGVPNYTPPDGWAVIPEDMPIPDTFPFVDIKVENGEVTAMTAGVVPEPEPIPGPPPTALERVEAQVVYTAMMTDTLIEEV